MPSWRTTPPGQRPGPVDARDCPYPMAGVPESPAHDWAAISTLIDEMVSDDNIRTSTLCYLESFSDQLSRQGSLSDRQVEIVKEIQARRDREGKRGF